MTNYCTISYFKRPLSFFLLCGFLLFSPFLGSQNLKFKNVGVADGLSVAYVQAVVQDKKGFIWLATQDGLNRYSGYEMLVYKNNPKSKNSINSNDVYTLLEDRKEKLWIGLKSGGLDEYDPVKNTFTHYEHSAENKNSLSDNSVRCLYEDNEGIIWIGTENGLNAFNPKTNKFKRYFGRERCSSCLLGNQVYSITQSKDGLLWIGTADGGLSSFSKKTNYFTQFPTPKKFTAGFGANYLELNRDRIHALFVNEQKQLLLVGTDGGGMGLFDLVKKQYVDFIGFKINHKSNELNNEHNRIWSIAQDSKGNCWIAANGAGLIKSNIETKKYKFYVKESNEPSSLSSNYLTGLYIDPQDNIWAGTQNGGLNIFFSFSLKFDHFESDTEEGIVLPNEFIFSVYQSRDSLVWVGTDNGGIFTIDLSKKMVQRYPLLSHKIANKAVLSIIQSKDGFIWIGTWGAGLIKFDPGTGKIKTYLENSINHSTITCLLEDSFGNLWIGTYGGGLFRFSATTGEFKKMDLNGGLTDNVIFCLFEDSAHNLWIGSESGGLCVKQITTFDSNEKFIVYAKNEKKKGICDNKVFSVCEDKLKNIWIGTANGLNKIDVISKKIEFYYETDGLPNSTVYGIVPDDSGKLWLTTNKGLSCFNTKAGSTENPFRNFDTKDGIQGLEFNQGAFHKGLNGLVLVGGENGLNIFNPNNIKDNAHFPPIYINSYKRSGKEVLTDTSILYKKHIELDYNQNFFSFDFVALDYSMPARNLYSYKMEGVDEVWSNPSPFRHVSYTQLQGGNYVFQVKAANSDGVWNPKPFTISIRVYPPWWKTTWFYVSVVILFILSVFGFIFYRTAKFRKANRLLENKVEERTRELAQKNKDILSSITYARRIQEALLPPLQFITTKLPQSFVLYKPKDIVSGDFYWFAEKDDLKIIAVVDCTGHGVPGAFMSMIGHNLLNQIVNENNITDPGVVLTHLHAGVQAALKQGVNEINTADGMDVSMCAINTEKFEVKFAGANRTLVIVNEEKELEKIEGDKFPIGGAQLDKERNFTTHHIQLKGKDMLYMFSDGYADQFGGDKGKKYMVKRFYEDLKTMQNLDMISQQEVLSENLDKWRGTKDQVDDVLVIGIRL